MRLLAKTLAALFGLSSASMAADQTACLTAVECLQQSQSLGIAGFAMGSYDVDGCFQEGDSAYFGAGGTVESMSAPAEGRIWCSSIWQQDVEVAPCDATTSPTVNNTTSLPDSLTNSPTNGPSLSPSKKPTGSPTKSPSYTPTGKPTAQSSSSPSTKPTKTPTFEPSRSRTPTASPSEKITPFPTITPIAWPTYTPTAMPSKEPSPSPKPSDQPTSKPSNQPTKQPSNDPTPNPSPAPTEFPTPLPILPVSTETATTTTKKTCLNQNTCDSKRQELGYDKFYVGNYNVKGCFAKDNVVYFGRGGTLQEMSQASLPGQLERVWCGENSGGLAPIPAFEGNNAGFIEPPEQHCIDIEVKTDRYGAETGFSLYTDPEDGSAPEALLDFPVESLESETTYAEQICVPTGKYVFTVEDDFHGLCCAFGQGSYSVSIDGEEVISGGNFQSKQVTYNIIAGFNPELSDRDNEWLEAHNSRREAFHTENNKEYRPLQWSPELAADAANWVDQMLPTCQIARESNLEEGENMAIRRFAAPSDNENPEQILTRWADIPLEQGKGYPENMALTQVMWRATRYVGCSDKVSVMMDGSYCYAMVCRYLRAGNCSMRQYDSWLEPTLMDRTGCGKSCPDEGCY